jgi:hypothetical protein
VDRGRRHQDPSLIAQSKGAARGRMEMFDHRLKVYRNADPGAFSPFPFPLCPPLSALSHCQCPFGFCRSSHGIRLLLTAQQSHQHQINRPLDSTSHRDIQSQSNKLPIDEPTRFVEPSSEI